MCCQPYYLPFYTLYTKQLITQYGHTILFVHITIIRQNTIYSGKHFLLNPCPPNDEWIMLKSLCQKGHPAVFECNFPLDMICYQYHQIFFGRHLAFHRQYPQVHIQNKSSSIPIVLFCNSIKLLFYIRVFIFQISAQWYCTSFLSITPILHPYNLM